ncbi:uncharacterized protein LY89DRAFT_158789 [Mollisia scopiformis]|uniref:Methyltransferase domain-containing protein n=1 Tax=Mollisia scopiformis TaxID=149040 RepID=A0A194X0U2_MOLSC|nr:uncharacterized protein LY89DRAFT_158789 [Mollisia scopiformis]KUJ13482.1 hypothetical protein LY89DRAFT_158789 [Mollisia scopiformis]
MTSLLPVELAVKDPAIEETDEWHMPTFAFHDLDYIPSGYGGILAPYIETGPGTMRAAATLMHLNLTPAPATQQVICDLGCGDGEFLIGLLSHLNSPLPLLPVSGFGIDYNASLIATASLNAITAGATAHWLTYDFNLDEHDLFSQIENRRVTHVFVYLVPKQLALNTVRKLLERLWGSGVVICCHKFQPEYLVATRTDILMDLVVYER